MGENFLPKTFTVLLLLCTAMTQRTLGQVTENFTDGNFTDNPVWSGTTGNYTVNVSGQLRLNAVAAGTSYLSTPFSIPTNHNSTWEFYLRQNFAGSGSNYSRVYLMSSQADLSGSLNGYFLQFGEDGANDAIKLFRQTGNTNSLVCTGPLATIAANPMIVKVRVTRSVIGEWVITADYTGGSNFVAVATGTDNTHTSSTHFGFRSAYTVTNVQNFFYDDISLTTQQAPDETAPTLIEVEVVSSTQIELSFSETITAATATNIENFAINGSHPMTSAISENGQTVTIELDEPLLNGHNFVLQVSGITDAAENIISSAEQSILYFDPVISQKHDLAITEFYPDPNPSVGLPLAEFVEIYNRSNHPFDLAGWKLTDGASTGTLTTRILLPGDYLILCHTSDVTAFQSYGAVMGLTTFPGLNNTGDTIKIRNPEGKTVDSLFYNMSWYHEIEDKQNGGWTLEKINPHDFCKDQDNWTPGVNPIGGTPGQQNSVFEVTADLEGPRIIGANQKDSTTISLVFDEKLNGIVPTVEQFTISPAMTIDTIYFTDGLNSIDIGFSTELDSSTVYSFEVQNISDCPGNSIHPDFNSISFKLDSIPPTLEQISVLTDSTLELHFSERISQNSSDVSHFALLDGAQPNQLIKPSAKVVRLIFDSPFANGVLHTLVLRNIADDAENQIDSIGVNFLFFQPVDPSFKDIILSELFPDPAPTVGLPEAEFIELFNRSSHPFNLEGWQITDGSSVGVLPEKILLPNQYVILCHSSHKNVFSPFGETIGLSVFPSLNNSSDHVKLISPSSMVVDSANYDLTWYHDPDKDTGGFSLEIINPDDFCRDANNWSASTDAVGGTPGLQNSVYSNAPDVIGPKVNTSQAKDARTLSFSFDEKLNSVLPDATNIEVVPAHEIDQITFGNNGLTHLDVIFKQPLDSVTRYVITFTAIKDCAGNEIQNNFSSISIKLDTLLPQILSWEVVSPSELSLMFSKKLSPLTIVPSHFTLTTGQHPQLATLVENQIVHLKFAETFENGTEQVLRINDVEDRFKNKIESSEIAFRYFQPSPVSRKDILITELLPDPSPIVSLPETEFIELFNRSTNPIDLKDWTISDGGTTASLPEQIILPRHFLILCPANRKEIFSVYGPVVGLATFPSLNNTTDTLVLKNFEGIVIDSVVYTDKFYRDDDKRDGGWTLELIDPDNICAEETNWIASEDTSGGTPGKINSVDEEMPDLTAPVLVSVFPENSYELKLTFNEKLENQLPEIGNIQMSPSLPVTQLSFVDKSLRVILVESSEPMIEGVGYSVTVSNIIDCSGNISNPTTTMVALPQIAEASNILVNEILFNPRSTGVDFVECYNNSVKFINLKNWSIANIVNDTIVNKKIISETDLLFHPGTYLVFTTDAPTLKGEYLSGIENTFVEMTLPSMPDDEGSVVLLDDHENVIDFFHYSAEYHSIFLKDDEGVSLERIHFDQPTSSPQNWKSAGATVGFATPGYANSNLVSAVAEQETVNVQPEVFSPTGQQSFAEIHYQFERGNLVANVKVVDAQGREVKVLADNQLLGSNGFLRWDGDNNSGAKARIGAYMIWFEVFDETGKVEVIKKRVVLAERF